MPAVTRHPNPAPLTQLPGPTVAGGMSLTEAVAVRRSVREFTPQPLDQEHVSQLCWSAQGITERGEGFRAAPSAGAVFPMTLHVADEHGVHEYRPRDHALCRTIASDVRRRLQSASLDQSCVGEAPVCFIISMDVAKMERKYDEPAREYCLLEAGHIGQNLLLQAAALDLGAVPVAAFDAERIAEILELPERLEPAYMVPVGHPRVH